MEDVLVCFVCQKRDDKIILFSEEFFRKCQIILEIRKKNNLKYKDITLPDEYVTSGYHRNCYKAFTGLMKKYYASESFSSKSKILKIYPGGILFI